IVGILKEQRDMGALLAAMLLVMVALIIPMDPMVMDGLLAINITLSIILIMTVSYIHSPLELSSFPTILLGATLFRLALNVATTRLILGGGGDEYRAGTLIYSFSTFITGQSQTAAGVTLGFIIFVIIVIIQFVVITKGSTRIAEVTARFTLDAMPGKQMAIDADLNAGLIDETQARVRREQLAQQADFFGAMDGASKFVRGDAIAGLIITAINLICGLVIGITIYEMGATEALSEYSRLTIGDGLVSQIPALIVSVAAGIIITRGESKDNLGGEVIYQLLTRKSSVMAGGIFLVVIGLALAQHLWFLILFGACLIFYSTRLSPDKERMEQYKKKIDSASQAAAAPGTAGASAELSGAPGAGGAAAGADSRGPEDVSNLLKLDQVELEVGYSLIPLVDSTQGGDLLERITMMRRQLAIEMGLLIKPIRVRDNMQLPPNDYSIKLRDAEIAHGMVLPEQFLAMDSGVVTEKIDGVETIEPAFGLPAVWIPESLRENASINGYTVVDATTVMSTHLTEIIKMNAHDILSRQTVSEMLDKQKESSSAIVDEVTDRLRLSEVQAVLKNLLREKVSIRNLETILETMGDYADRIKEPEILTEYVRARLGRSICTSFVDPEMNLFCVTLSPELEDYILKAIRNTEGGAYLALDPLALQGITEACNKQLERLVSSGHHPVILTSAQVRAQVYNAISASLPAVTVLSYNEIVTTIKIESLGVIDTPKVNV
ncbi:MAG: flagellar biosynthesis protein FlhA, partial [Planctomycetes bacterium]|nr:flagellar biosynthesis protein FlhA [Planctomycetota bacterium]